MGKTLDNFVEDATFGLIKKKKKPSNRELEREHNWRTRDVAGPVYLTGREKDLVRNLAGAEENRAEKNSSEYPKNSEANREYWHRLDRLSMKMHPRDKRRKWKE